MQNERTRHDGLSEATFHPDVHIAVNSLGTVGPVSSPPPSQEMLMSSPSLCFPRGLLPEGEGGRVSERERCHADRQSLEKTWRSPLRVPGSRLPSQCCFPAQMWTDGGTWPVRGQITPGARLGGADTWLKF